MEHRLIAVALLDAHERNYKIHPESQIAGMKKSLERFDQVRSIVVYPKSDGRYTVLAGHGILKAAREAGKDALYCDIVPSTWDRAMQEAYMVADNKLSEGAEDNTALLQALLGEQQTLGFDLAALGATDALLQAMMEQPVVFKEFDEHIEDDMPTELCKECGKVCLKEKA